MARCKSCHAHILWAVTENGVRMPVDFMPTPAGNVRLSDAHPPIARIVGAAIDLLDSTDDGTRYMPHHATCRDAATWKGRKR